MCGQAVDDNDVRAGEAGRRCALEGDQLFEEEAGKVKVIAMKSMRIKMMAMRMSIYMGEMCQEKYEDQNHGDEDAMQRKDVDCREAII